MKARAHVILFLLLTFVVLSRTREYGQGGHLLPHSGHEDYGPEFFKQLGRLFEQLSEADIHHVFQLSRPAQCSEFVGNQDEWHNVASFSGKKKFGNWYDANINELKSDLAVYIFKGICVNERAGLQVTTKVPVDGAATLQEVQLRVNPPVRAYFNTDNKAYTFDLPYLFRGRSENGDKIYTLHPQHVSDRYVTDITSHWDCKAVAEEYVTYNFLICHTQLFGHDPVDITHGRDKPTYSFNASAYSILSNGKEK